MKHGKNYVAAAANVEKQKTYEVRDALALVIDNAKPVEAAVKAGLDKIETINYDFDDAKINGPKYYGEFFEVINKDDRVKTK